jgi:DNA-binding response OmpR family regulator
MAMDRKLILIVEDDSDLALGLGVRLQAAGYKAMTAEDSITALSTAKQVEPALIILDLGLPGGDGITFLSRLRSLAQVSMIPVIVLTARGPEWEEEAVRSGAQAFFQKPVDNELLLAEIERLLSPTS